MQEGDILSYKKKGVDSVMKKSFSLMTVMVLLLPSFVFGQSAKDAYKAFKKIEANTETGISSMFLKETGLFHGNYLLYACHYEFRNVE